MSVRVVGVLVVRDEVDILRLCVLHHLTLGCERILALDNGSTDGTTTVLRRLAARTPLSWSSDPGTYRQAEFTTGLAADAARLGGDWMLPLDADEFWVAPGGLRDALDRPHDGAVVVSRVEFIQRREQRRATPSGVLTMTRRVPDAVEGEEPIHGFEADEKSMFEAKPAAKLALRTGAELVVDRGGHTAAGLAGDLAQTDAITILHAPLRARACLARKAVHGERLEDAGYDGLQGWQVRHFAALDRAGTLDRAWAAHSYGSDDTLRVGGRRGPLIRDYRLATALRRWVRPPARQLAARALCRTY